MRSFAFATLTGGAAAQWWGGAPSCAVSITSGSFLLLSWSVPLISTLSLTLQLSNRAFRRLMPPKLLLPPLGLSQAPFAAAVPILPSRRVCPPPAAPPLPPSRLIAAWPPRSAQRGRRARALVAPAFTRFLGPRPPAQAAPVAPPPPPTPSASGQEAALAALVVLDSDQAKVKAAGAAGARRSLAPV